ncbi:hypothetical protein E2C01_018661 [Portunus trituberculatus]|uniref:Uncharacterized protein n=1 Tax=Portunus trituberculatus TaxID=210409 RepID=A0A5B7DXP6_PORTR|nr:hypothetical protein [Portunus trituberculatus]
MRRDLPRPEKEISRAYDLVPWETGEGRPPCWCVTSTPGKDSDWWREALVTKEQRDPRNVEERFSDKPLKVAKETPASHCHKRPWELNVLFIRGAVSQEVGGSEHGPFVHPRG